MKSKHSALLLGILLIIAALTVSALGTAVNEQYKATGVPGFAVFGTAGSTTLPLTTVSIILSVALLAAGLALVIRNLNKEKKEKLVTAGVGLIAAAFLLYWLIGAMVRESVEKDYTFDFTVRLLLLIDLVILANGAIKNNLKSLLMGGGLFVLALILAAVGAHLYPDTASTIRATHEDLGFELRIFYTKPSVYISLVGLCRVIAWIMGLIGAAAIIGYGMSHLGLRASRAISNTAIHILLVVMSIIWLVPFVCIVLQSFRVESTHQVGYVIPQQWGLDNYISLFETNFPRWYINTFVIALITAVLQTVIVLCMSYTLSRFRFKMRNFLMRFMLILGMFPGMLSMIILYRVLADLGMTQANAMPGLVLVYVASSGMGYYVSKGFFDTIPKSLDEAARVDGATRAQVLYKIILPLSKPIVIYTILTAFMGPWGDYVFARYISMNEPLGMNAAVGLYSWLSQDQIAKHYTQFCAGGVLVAVPVTILFMCLQKYYVEGVTGGAVKG